MAEGPETAKHRHWPDLGDATLWFIEWAFGPLLVIEGLVALLLLGSSRGWIGVGFGLAFSVAIALVSASERRAGAGEPPGDERDSAASSEPTDQELAP